MKEHGKFREDSLSRMIARHLAATCYSNLRLKTARQKTHIPRKIPYQALKIFQSNFKLKMLRPDMSRALKSGARYLCAKAEQTVVEDYIRMCIPILNSMSQKIPTKDDSKAFSFNMPFQSQIKDSGETLIITFKEDSLSRMIARH